MVLNQGKCCYMSFGSNPDKSDLILEDSTKISSAEEYVILVVTTGNSLAFYNHLKNICKKIANRLNADSLATDSLATVFLFGNFALGVQIIILTDFKNKH